MDIASGSLRQRLIRSLAWTLGWVLILVLFASGVNLVGIRIVGDVDGWSHWLQGHRLYFLGWRVCLYGGTAYGWVWMRKRIRCREPGAPTRARLLRVEMAVVFAILLIEATLFLQTR
jgi:hypothetical protein